VAGARAGTTRPAGGAAVSLFVASLGFGLVTAAVLAIASVGFTLQFSVTNVLNLVDLALTANLILIVIFSSYENFIRRIDPAEHPDWPEGLTQVDFGELKQKLLGSIVGIAAVDALAWYFDLEKEPDTAKLIWVLAFPLTFAACMLILAISDRLGRRSDKRSG